MKIYFDSDTNFAEKIKWIIAGIVLVLLSAGLFSFRVKAQVPGNSPDEKGIASETGEKKQDSFNDEENSPGRKPPKPIAIRGKEGNATYLFWVETGRAPFKGDIDGDLLILGSTIHMEGKVHGSIVAFGSMIILEPGSSVDGNMVLFASAKRMGYPGIVRGKIVEHDFGPGAYMALFYFFLCLKGLLSMFVSNGDVVFALLLMIFVKKRILSVCNHLVERPSGSLLWGMMGIIVFIFTGMLLFATIYGAVLNVILLAVFALLFATAFASAAYLIGQTLEDRGWIGKREFIIKGLLGLVIIYLAQLGLAFIPVIGIYLSGVLGMIIRTAGTGATLMAWFRKPE